MPLRAVLTPLVQVQQPFLHEPLASDIPFLTLIISGLLAVQAIDSDMCNFKALYDMCLEKGCPRFTDNGQDLQKLESCWHFAEHGKCPWVRITRKEIARENTCSFHKWQAGARACDTAQCQII